jgi:hypothetical protein
MKTYTNKEDAEIISKILPPGLGEIDLQYKDKDSEIPTYSLELGINTIPAWSLGRLIETLDNIKKLSDQRVSIEIGRNAYNKWYVGYVNRYDSYVLVVSSDELIDACIKMFKELKKQEFI